MCAGLAGLAFSLPLIVPQMWFMGGVVRRGGVGGGIGEHLAALFVPTPLVHAPHPDGWGNVPDMTTFYYAGTVWAAVVLLAALACFAALVVFRAPLRRRAIADNAWLFCAVAAFLIALGPQGVLWPLMSRMPVMDKFTGPWKLLLFFHLYAAPAGALVLQRMTEGRRRIAVAISGVVLALLAWNSWQARGSFYNYGDRPYLPMDPQLRTLLFSGPETTRGRIYSIAPKRNNTAGYTHSLMLALPSYYGVAAFDGYDPFVEMTPVTMFAHGRVLDDPEGALKRYGVRWVLVHATSFARPVPRNGRINPFDVVDPYRRAIYDRLMANARYRLQLPDLAVVELEGADPLAFARGTHAAMPIHLDGGGATVDVRAVERGGPVVVNVLLRKGMEAFVDGAPRQLFHDDDGRVIVEVPPHSKTLQVLYRPPWGVALLAGVAALLVALAASFAIRRWWPATVSSAPTPSLA